MSGRSYLSIGDVLTLLRQEFPDVTISKIRFLESQGLVNPERTPSGYRKFYEHDVERLRWVLRQQREHFLPLKVIRDRLAAENGRCRTTTPAAEAAVAAGAPSRAGGRPTGRERRAPPPERRRWPSGRSGGPDGAAADLAHHGAPRPRRRRRCTRRRGASRPGAAPPRSGGRRHGTDGLRPEPGRSRAPARASAGRSPAGRRAAVRAPGTGPPGRRPPAAPPSPGWPRPRLGSGPSRAARRRRPPASARPPERRPRPTPAPRRRRSRPAAARGRGRRGAGQRRPRPAGLTGASLTPEELCSATGLSATDVAALEGFGLVEPTTVAGVLYYDEDALTVAQLVAEFARYGIEPRHLRLYRNAVDREVGLVEQIITPLLRQRNPEARQRAVDTAADLGDSARACGPRCCGGDAPPARPLTSARRRRQRGAGARPSGAALHFIHGRSPAPGCPGRPPVADARAAAPGDRGRGADAARSSSAPPRPRPSPTPSRA